MKIGYLMQEDAADIRNKPSSGPSTHVRQVFQQLRELGHTARLIARFGTHIWKSDDLVNFEPVTVLWLDRGPLRWFERAVRRVQFDLALPYLTFFESLRFAAACCQELGGFDLLYERMSWMGYGGGLASLRMAVPLVLENNGDHLTEMEILGLAPRGLQRWVSTQLMAWGVKQAAHVVAAGDGWRTKCIDRWGLPPERVTTIDNGCELVNLLQRNQLRAFQINAGQINMGQTKLAVQSSEPMTIVYLGGFQPWQGVQILLRAFAQAIDKGVNLRLFLIGSSSNEEEIKEQVRALGITEFVTLTGQLPAERFATYLANADVGVAPYCGWTEFVGLKLLDYKAAALATVASGQNGQPSIIIEGETGLIVPPCDEDALCNALLRLNSDPQLRLNLGRKARLEAEKVHSWRHTAEKLEKLFEQVIRHRGNPIMASFVLLWITCI